MTPSVPYRVQEGHGARNRGECITVIANPRAGGGRAGSVRSEVERAVDRAFERGRVLWTDHPGHATELARQAAEESDIIASNQLNLPINRPVCPAHAWV